MSYFYSFDLPLTIARPFNTYGPRQSARAIIPTIITQLANGLGEIKVGDLTPTRDFTYVIDTCEGFIALALSNSTLGETVNIGNNSEISVEHLCEMIAMLMKKPLRIHQDSIRKRPPKSEVRQLRCDNTKLVTLTGFAPKVSLEEGLLRSIDWFTQPQNLKEYKTELYAV
jgi:nucleoside-diphosphate-sugar epimerase